MGSHEATQCLKSTPSHQPGDGSRRRELKAVSQPIDGSDQQWLPQVGSPPAWLTPGGVGWPLSGKQKVASSALLSKCKAAAGSSKPALLRQRRCQRGLAQRSLRAPSELVASLLPACSTTEAPPLTPPPPTSSPWAADGCWLLAAGWVTPKWSKLGFSAEGRGGEPQQRRLLCCWWLAPTSHHTANHDQPLAFSTLMAASKCLHLARTLWSSERMTRNGQRGVNLALFFALWLAPAMNHLSIENARLSRVAVVSPSYESLRRAGLWVRIFRTVLTRLGLYVFSTCRFLPE